MMNCVTIVGTVEGEPVQAGPTTELMLAVPRWGPLGREPGVIYVEVVVAGGFETPAEGDLLGLTGWVEQLAHRVRVECVANMVTTLKAHRPS